MNSGNKPLEIIALVLAIVSIPLACTYAVAGLVVGVISYIMAFKLNKTSQSMIVMAAMVAALIGCVIAVCSMLFMIIFYVMAAM